MMSVSRTLLLAAVPLCLALGGVRCSKHAAEKTGGSAAPASTKPSDDFKATVDAFNASKDTEAKNRLWFDFLKRNPNNDYTLDTIDYLVSQYFLKERKDPEGAVRFAVEQMKEIRDAKLKQRAETAMISLYGEVGKKKELRELAEEIKARRGLTLSESILVAEAALDAGDWQFARAESETLLRRNTPENIRAEAGAQKLTDEQVRQSVARNRGQALLARGRAALELKESRAALADFAEAGKLASYDFVGLPAWPFRDLDLYWAKALLQNGDPQGALKKISVDAMIRGGAEAMQVLSEAYRAQGGNGSLEEYIARTRPSIARTIPEFSAYDYNKKKVRYADLKGEVTLIAFWNPG
jgi:tetratricopeptide (TPR) repeat protein